ncbi:hypothetical protein [Xanthomonas phage X1]|nr:hypothetical protein [Xanthomonas phage X1]
MVKKVLPTTTNWLYAKEPMLGAPTIANITQWLRKNKLTVVQKGRRLTVNHRANVEPVRLADEIQLRLEGSRRISNLAVNVNGIAIVVSASLKGNAGEDNEEYLMHRVNRLVGWLGGPVDVTFKSKKKAFEIKGVVEVYLSGRDTSGHKKADVEFWTKSGKMIPVSLKQGNASFFSSADSELKEIAEASVRYAFENALTNFEMDPATKIRKINPDLVIEPTDKEKEFALFGNDILKGKGAIIRQSFTMNDFFQDVPNKLFIHVEDIWQELRDVPEIEQPVIQIRNDKDRNRSHPLLKGLRALTIKRAVVPKNARWIDREKLK